jgi:hypothetical protein
MVRDQGWVGDGGDDELVPEALGVCEPQRAVGALGVEALGGEALGPERDRVV